MGCSEREVKVKVDSREYANWMAYYHMITDPNYGRVEATGEQILGMFAGMPGVIDKREKKAG